MPRPKLSDQEIDQMRQRILDAAIDIVRNDGPEKLSIRAIADHLGVSHMVLYTYFASRDAIFAALKEQQRALIQARHADALATARSGDPRMVIREMLDEYLTMARENTRIYRFLWGTLLSNSGAEFPMDEGISEEINFMAALIGIGIERGLFLPRDPSTAALMILGMVNGALLICMVPAFARRNTLASIDDEIIATVMSYLTGTYLANQEWNRAQTA